MKFRILILIMVLSSLQAETFEEYKQKQAHSFKNYQNKMDLAFVNYLKGEWSDIQSKPSEEVYKEKKPKKLPVKKQIKPTTDRALHIDTKRATKKKPLLHVKKEPTKNPKIVMDSKYEYKQISYFGLLLKIPLDPAVPTQLSPINSSKDVSRFWDKMSHFDFLETVKDINLYQKHYLLNDWSIYQIVEKTSEKLYKKSYEQKLFSWFLLNKLGYKVKIGYKNRKVILLSATECDLYSTPFLKINSERYYAIDYYLKGDVGAFYTYKKDFPASTRKISFSLETLPLLPYKAVEKKLAFHQENVSFTLKFNQNLLAYMQNYPQVDYKIYFDAEQEPAVEQEIVKIFHPLLEGKSKKEALNLLLHFVQKSFAYQTDDEQFGHEKVMFAIETLFYPYSDCDDRAVLFAYLAERLLHVSVVGLKFSDHMATAIYVDEITPHFDYLQKDSFIVGDPTYINANLGSAMPKYINQSADIITPKKTAQYISTKKQIIVKK